MTLLLLINNSLAVKELFLCFQQLNDRLYLISSIDKNEMEWLFYMLVNTIEVIRTEKTRETTHMRETDLQTVSV